MGLDMYLTRSAKSEEIGYWRKANAIHGFFERECTECGLEDCKEVIVSKELIEKLLYNCQTVLGLLMSGEMEEHVYDEQTKAKVNEILPPTMGFFFGSYEIDELYKDSILETIEICQNALRDTDWDNEIVRYYAWW